MSYRVTYGQLGNEQNVFNPAAGVYLLSCKATFEANVSGVLEMELPPNHPLFGAMEPMSTDMEVRLYEDDEELLRGRIITGGDDLDMIGRIKVEDQQAYLNDVSCRPYTTYYVEDQKDQLPIVSGNLAQHLIEDYNAHCTAGREFSFRGADVGDDLRVCTTEERPIRDELADTVYAAGGFAMVKSFGQSRTIEILANPPHGEQVIRVGENLLGYDHDQDFTGVVTAIIAKGRGQRSATESDDSAHEDEFGLETIQDGNYGVIRIDGDRAISVEGEKRFGIIEERRSYEVATPQGLFELVERDLAGSIIDEQSIDISAYDLHNLNPDIKPLRLCNVYTVESPLGALDMMLTEIDLDICDPSNSNYHFGRLASSLSRTGVAEAASSREDRRGITYTGNKDRHEYQDGHKKLIDGLDEIGDGLVDLEHLYHGFDERLDGVDRAVEIAKEAAKNTAYGICNTGSEVRAKSVVVAYPQGGEFELKDGTVVSIKMTNANAADRPTLQVSGTGAYPITTGGVNEAWWEAGQTVLFTFMDDSWCTMSAPVWTSSATIGDPRDYHIELEPDRFSMCIGENQYINADDDGFQVGFTATVDNSNMAIGRRNIHVGSDSIKFRQGQTDYMTMDDTGIQVGMSDGRHMYTYIGSDSMTFVNPKASSDLVIQASTGTSRSPKISSESGLNISAGSGFTNLENDYGSVHINTTTGAVAVLDCTRPDGNLTFGVGRDSYYTGLVPWAMTSIVVRGDGTDRVAVPYSTLGLLGATTGFAFAVTNGDWAACDVIVTGTSIYDGTLYVHFHKSAPAGSYIRLNVLGVPVSLVHMQNDPGEQGPEIFDDPTKPETPGIE